MRFMSSNDEEYEVDTRLEIIFCLLFQMRNRQKKDAGITFGPQGGVYDFH